METIKLTEQHTQLARLAGNWEGIARTWFGPDELADESPVKGTMKLILDGRFILHEYKGSWGDKKLEGMAIIGYHADLGKYQCAWIDSFHNNTAIMFSEGERQSPASSVLGSYTYVGPEGEVTWGWRTEFTVVSDDEIILTAYNIQPGEPEQKATETVYKRVASL